MKVWGQIARVAAPMVLMSVALGACGGVADMGSLKLMPKSDGLFSNSMMYSDTAPRITMAAAAPNDMVDSAGQCPAPSPEPTATPAEGAEGGAAPAQPVLGGIALQMTECQVVQRAGAPDNVEIGSNERGDRSVTLTYRRAPWPGVYRFSEGRLISVDRVGDPVPEKRQKRPPAKKSQS